MKQVALITGASRGIGRAVAAALAREGYAVAINYRQDRQAAQDLVDALCREGREAAIVQGDVADRRAAQEMVWAAEAALGPVTLLVNNAGVSWQGLFQDMDDDTWARMLAVNVTGVRNATLAVLPGMLARKAGCIVNMASIWGLRGASCEVAYAATKAAVVGLTRSLALELAPSGIRVNAVAPGSVETDMLRSLGDETLDLVRRETPLGRLGAPEDIARAVVFLASEGASFLTGQVLTADGGYTV